LAESYPFDVRVRFRLVTGQGEEEIDRVVPAGTTEIPDVGLTLPPLNWNDASGESFDRLDDFLVTEEPDV
jgi:hypothetical protein